jgi:toxin ParE1/3/4
VTRELHVSEEAEQELRTAYLWYESKRRGLGEEFLLCLEVVFETVLRHPDRYRRIHEDARSALLRRFPYAVIYTSEADRVTIVAVFHGSRDPRLWMGRLTE